MDPRLAFPRVAVAGGPAVEFCVAMGEGDPIVPWLLEHDWIDEPVQRAFQALVEPGARVLDVGCHLGLFTLPAAALGAEVVAVDANARHIELLREAVRRNRFEDRVEVVHAAVAADGAPVQFVERSVHGHIRVDADGDAPAVRVPGTTVDALVAARGWDGLDLLKIDVEGGEPGAFAGMAGLLASGARPAIVFECNATTLPHAGASVVSLRATLLNLGYELLMIDHLHPGKLRAVVEARAVQPEAVTDYVAVTGRPPRLEREWAIEPPLTLEETVIRVDRGARDVDRGYRRYAADLLAEGPAWLRDHPAVAATRSLLTADDEAAVRDAFAPRERPGPGAEHADADAPAPLGLALYAASVSLPDGARGVERARGQEGGELLHAGIDVHLARGHVLAVRGDGPAPTTLLRVLAGLEQPAAGHVERGGTALLVGAAGDGLEPELSVAENVGVFTAFAGGDIAAASGRAADIAGAAGLEGRLDDLLAELGPDAPVRLALVVALTEALPDVLLLDALPAFREPFATWARKAAAAFVAGGGAIVQAGDPLLAPADATLELDRPPVPA